MKAGWRRRAAARPCPASDLWKSPPLSVASSISAASKQIKPSSSHAASHAGPWAAASPAQPCLHLGPPRACQPCSRAGPGAAGRPSAAIAAVCSVGTRAPATQPCSEQARPPPAAAQQRAGPRQWQQRVAERHLAAPAPCLAPHRPAGQRQRHECRPCTAQLCSSTRRPELRRCSNQPVAAGQRAAAVRALRSRQPRAQPRRVLAPLAWRPRRPRLVLPQLPRPAGWRRRRGATVTATAAAAATGS